MPDRRILYPALGLYADEILDLRVSDGSDCGILAKVGNDETAEIYFERVQALLTLAGYHRFDKVSRNDRHKGGSLRYTSDSTTTRSCEHLNEGDLRDCRHPEAKISSWAHAPAGLGSAPALCKEPNIDNEKNGQNRAKQNHDS